jgi:hypothetical protein
MKNMTSKYFPVLSPRQSRGIVKNFVNPQGILDKEDVWWIDNKELYKNGSRIFLDDVTLSDEPKTLAKMGAYIIIMPDKVWVNTSRVTPWPEHGYMERTNEKGESYKRKIHVLLSVSVGAGLPKNKALMYNIIKETYANGAMSQEEYRQKLEEYVGLPYDEVMMQQEKQQAALQEQVKIPLGTQSRNVFNGGTNPAALDRMQEQRTGGNYNVTK